MITKVFISYAKEDCIAAEKLYRDLKAVPNIEAWFDKECLKPGMKWPPAIRKAIRESEFFIALFSKNSSNRRGFVNTELNQALEILNQMPEGKIYLIPIRLEECDPPHESLREIQYEDFFPDWGKGFNKILSVINPVSQNNERKINISAGYEYRCGIVDLDLGLTNLHQIAERMNSIQKFFHFTCPNIPKIQTHRLVFPYKGVNNLSTHLLPQTLYENKPYLNVDFVACLTKYPISFYKDGDTYINYFSRPSGIDNRFMFLSTHLLYDFTKQAKCTFEKGIAYILFSQLLVYFTDWGYHYETKECLMDFCKIRSDMIKGLKKMRLCPECLANIEMTKFKEAVQAILSDEMKI